MNYIKFNLYLILPNGSFCLESEGVINNYLVRAKWVRCPLALQAECSGPYLQVFCSLSFFCLGNSSPRSGCPRVLKFFVRPSVTTRLRLDSKKKSESPLPL